MKKKFLLLILLFIPGCFVKADMGAPLGTSIDLIVSNPEGTYEFTDYQLTRGDLFPYGTILNTNQAYFEIIDGKKYIYARYNEDNYELYLAEDLSIVNEYYDYTKLYSNNKLEKYAFKDVEMYKGPSKLYGKVGKTIKEGTTLSSNYYDEIWMYVVVDGVAGWVEHYTFYWKDLDVGESNLASISNGLTVYTTRDNIEMYRYPNSDELLDITIPKDVELNLIYSYSLVPSNNFYYVIYNGEAGWIKNYGNLKSRINKKFTVIGEDGVNVYSEVNSDSNVVGKLDYLKEYTAIYECNYDKYSMFYYVETDSFSGWIGENRGGYVNKNILFDSDKETSNNKDYLKITVTHDVTLYEKSNMASETIGFIQKGQTIYYSETKNDEKDRIWYHVVDYNGLSGWITLDNLSTNLDIVSVEEAIKNKTHTGIIAFIICIVVSASAVGILLIRNNKKKYKKDEVVIEDGNEERIENLEKEVNKTKEKLQKENKNDR